MAFCDFCTCDNCTNGAKDLFHAETTDGRWICDVCFAYDQCTSDNNGMGKPRSPNGPCADPECEQRPRLRVSPGPDRWIEGSGEAQTVTLAELQAMEKSS